MKINVYGCANCPFNAYPQGHFVCTIGNVEDGMIGRREHVAVPDETKDFIMSQPDWCPLLNGQVEVDFTNP